MSPTEKGQNTQSRIVTAAEQLFYENGYADTTVSQITELAGVNNGLFTYYFKTKNNLSGMISTAYRLSFRNAVSQKMYEVYKKYDLALGIAVEYRKDIELMNKNPKLRRFIIEQRADSKPNLHISYEEIMNLREDFKTSKRGHFYQLQKRLINPQISETDLNIYQIAGLAVTDALTYAYHERFLFDTTPEYMADKYIEICFFLLQLPQERIEQLKEESRIAAAAIDVKYKNYFRVE